jgi:MAF protein
MAFHENYSMLPIVLASSSPYRKALLEKLGLDFLCCSPNIDESPRPHELATQLVERLALAKAHALTNHYPNHLIIGSDQVALLDELMLGKPHTHENARAQLLRAKGKEVIFKTGLCLLNSASGAYQLAHEDFSVFFRQLEDQQIDNYLHLEKPYDCAGSFKAEGLGITLFTKLQGRDPNTLIGLPLIKLVEMLLQENVDPLGANH